MPLVLVRTPTYRRPELLTRAMRCLQAQTHEDWICEVRDDCPDGSARAVVEELGDPRIRHVWNQPRKYGVRNLDDCFLCENPYQADYFFMLEEALLHKGADGRGSPFPGRTYPTASVTGMPRAV